MLAARCSGVNLRMATRLAAYVLFATAASACGVGTIEDGEPGEPMGPDAGAAPRAVDIEGPAVLPHVQTFANAACGATAACTISTYSGHTPTAARALDILTSDVYGKRSTDNNALGDVVAAYALANQPAHGITYVIWRQRINSGDGWEPMGDRGSITQNHYDHVHVSFDATVP